MAVLGLSKSSWGFDPRSIPRCMSWIDAADRSTLTLSAGSVTAIRDKANYVNYTVTGTVNTGLVSLSGKNLLSLASNGTGTATGNVFSNAHRTLFMVAQIDNSTVPGVTPRTYTFYGGPTTGGSVTLYYWHGSGNLAGGRSGLDTAVVVASNLPATGFFNSSFILSFANNPNDIRLNGTSLTLTTNTAFTFSTGTITQSFNGAAGNNQPWRLGEMLLYDDTLTTPRRHIIEGYLAWKWGLVANLPVTHPYKSIGVFGRAFTPAIDLSGCVLWLDAADRSSITIPSGSNVSQWSDKSGLENHATQVNSINQPFWVSNVRNGLPVMRFVGARVVNDQNSRFFGNTTMAFPNAPYTIFTVAHAVNNTGLSTSGYNYIMKIHIATDFRGFVGSTGNTFTTFVGSASAWNDVAALSGGTQVTSNWTVFTIANTGTANGLLPYISGNARTAKNGTTVAATGYSIGDAGTSFLGQNWNGDIAEIIVFNRDMSYSDRYVVEGYLAWKWGITADFPAAHSYKNTRLRPEGVSYPAIAISNLDLWLDGTDPCGNQVKPANGANVLTWFDKSGSNFNMTASTGTPTYDAVNNAIKLGGAAALLTSNVTAAPMTVFFVYKNYNGSGPIFSTNNVLSVDGFWPNNSWDTTLNRLTIARQDGNNFGFWYAQNNTPYPLNRTCMVAVQYSGTASGSTITGYLDASQVFTSTTTGTITRTFLRLAQRGSTGEFLTADYNEVLYYSRILTLQERQGVEGYLAWKWGLVPFLPNNHPYKKVSP